MKTEDLIRHANRYTRISPLEYHIDDTSDEAWVAARKIVAVLNSMRPLGDEGLWHRTSDTIVNAGIGICFEGEA